MILEIEGEGEGVPPIFTIFMYRPETSLTLYLAAM
jgi:hypothetical protein